MSIYAELHGRGPALVRSHIRRSSGEAVVEIRQHNACVVTGTGWVEGEFILTVARVIYGFGVDSMTLSAISRLDPAVVEVIVIVPKRIFLIVVDAPMPSRVYVQDVIAGGGVEHGEI